MNYWLIKANPRKNIPLSELFRPGTKDRWHSAIIPKQFQKDDPLVFWQSGTNQHVIAFGKVANPLVEVIDPYYKIFEVLNETPIIEGLPNIESLRKNPLFSGAYFLKAGPAGTIFPLTKEQGEFLWSCPWGQPPGKQTPEDPSFEASAYEGGMRFYQHMIRERQRGIKEAKRNQFIKEHGKLYCEACGLDTKKIYPDGYDDLYEVHHRIPLSEVIGVVETRLDDLAILCPTCHRAIHRKKPVISVEKLRNIIIQKR